MNSLDPWRVIVTDEWGGVVVPRPYYGHPFHREIPSWIHYGGGGPTRQLFDGVFVGAEGKGAYMTDILGAQLTALSAPGAYYGSRYGRSFYGPSYGPSWPSYGPSWPSYGPFVGAGAVPQRTGLTAEVAPLIAPATGGIIVRKELDDKQVLHVEICVDGKCHRTSMDLAPAIALVLAKLAQWHTAQHAQGGKVSEEVVVGCVGCTVQKATDAIVGDLVAGHIDTIAAGILGDIAGAVRGAVKGVTGGIRSTLQKLKGPIGAAAGIAAASAAMAIPGPEDGKKPTQH